MKCSKIAALLLLPVLLCTAGCSVKLSLYTHLTLPTNREV